MKKAITLTALILSAILIFDSMNLGSALVMLLIAGQIPGTSASIDAGAMLIFFMFVSGILAGRLTSKLLSLLGQTTPLRGVINR